MARLGAVSAEVLNSLADRRVREVGWTWGGERVVKIVVEKLAVCVSAGRIVALLRLLLGVSFAVAGRAPPVGGRRLGQTVW